MIMEFARSREDAQPMSDRILTRVEKVTRRSKYYNIKLTPYGKMTPLVSSWVSSYSCGAGAGSAFFSPRSFSQNVHIVCAY